MTTIYGTPNPPTWQHFPSDLSRLRLQYLLLMQRCSHIAVGQCVCLQCRSLVLQVSHLLSCLEARRISSGARSSYLSLQGTSFSRHSSHLVASLLPIRFALLSVAQFQVIRYSGFLDPRTARTASSASFCSASRVGSTGNDVECFHIALKIGRDTARRPHAPRVSLK